MSKMRSLTIFVCVGLLLSSWSAPVAGLAATQAEGSPAPIQAVSARATLIVHNPTGSPLPQLVLKGARTYTFYRIPTGGSQYIIEKGAYRIEYTACGAKRVMTANIKSDIYRLRIARCKLYKVIINNQTGGDVKLNLSGPPDYQFKVPPGVSRITVFHGFYDFTLVGACGTKTGRIKIYTRVRWTWWCR